MTPTIARLAHNGFSTCRFICDSVKPFLDVKDPHSVRLAAVHSRELNNACSTDISPVAMKRSIDDSHNT